MKIHNIDQDKIPKGASFVLKAIHRTGSLLGRRTSEELNKETDFNLAEWRIASGLYTFGTASQKALIDYTGSEQAHTSRVLAGLEQRGLVQSQKDQKDGRARVFELTMSGNVAFEKALPKMEAFLGPIDDALSEKELNVLIGYLKRLINAAGYDEHQSKDI